MIELVNSKVENRYGVVQKGGNKKDETFTTK